MFDFTILQLLNGTTACGFCKMSVFSGEEEKVIAPKKRDFN